MAVLSKESYFEAIRNRVGDDTSDEAVSFIEDMTDTFNDLENNSSKSEVEEWERKYNELDKSWREKYTARFFDNQNTNSSNDTSASEVKDEQTEDVKSDGEKISFDDLFEEREG